MEKRYVGISLEAEIQKISNRNFKIIILVSIIILSVFFGCKYSENNQEVETFIMKEKQITFSEKNHALDNNDNFSPDDKFLCYDTRITDLANCKSIEKVEIKTGIETVLWKPESISGELAAPGVAAVSYHPSENKVIFIHGPFLDEVKERGYYNIRNRTAVEVSADGKQNMLKVDMRDHLTDKPTINGAHRGGTHRHEYSRDGNKIGFTYDDFLNQDYDRTIGYMEANGNAPKGYSHYFALLVKPVKKGESKPGEIEKASSDSWVDSVGRMRAFIGKVRAENGVDYENSLFVAEIPDSVDVTTANSGNNTEYPTPPRGIKVRRLTHDKNADGIVRGSYDGKKIAYFSLDTNGIKQVFFIPVDGSDLISDADKQPKQVTFFDENANHLRWHPSDNWIFSITDGNIAVTYVGNNNNFGRTFLLTNDDLNREQLVVSNSGNQIAYGINLQSGKKDEEWKQIFVMEIDWKKLNNELVSK
ncbi:MAG: DUF3748 domain-containing protein [Bacteroidota bacterium]